MTASAQVGTERLALPADVSRWVAAGALGGVAGALFGVVMPPAEFMPMVATLYGAESVTAGWAFHLIHSVIFGLLFLFIADRLGGSTDTGSRALIGAAYGVVLWLIAASYIMPLWTRIVDVGPAIPDWSGLSLVAHIVYGASLGLLLPAIAQRGR